jgi:putative ABC transport system permease protein
LTIDLVRNAGLLAGLFGFLVIVGLAAGAYPAYVLSTLNTADTVKGKFGARSGGMTLRRVLVVFQFAVCILFLIGSAVAVRQLRYVTGKDLGFTKDNILLVYTSQMKDRAQAFKDQLLLNPAIKNVSLSIITPGVNFDWPTRVRPEGLAKDQALNVPVFKVDADYFRTFGIPVVQGRDFQAGPADQGRSAIINQEAAREFGWTDPIGKRLTLPGENDKDVVVVGVARDFNLETLYKSISPYVFTCSPEPWGLTGIRVGPGDLTPTIGFIRKTWESFAPNDVMEVQFLDETIARHYEQDERTKKILMFASILAVTIACLGLLGLAAYSAESRTKELGIRKVLGASTPNLVLSLAREFGWCVLAGNLIAWPAAFFFMKRWLQNFAYRIPMGFGVFVLSGLAALVIALLTVSYQSVKAARADPVEALRYE